MKASNFASLTRLIRRCSQVAVLTVLPLAVVHAVPIAGDISITGSTDFDSGFSFGATTGGFSVTSGGVTTMSTFAGSTVTGADPLAGTLTDTGDGFGISGSASVTDDEFAIGLDMAISLSNASLTDTYEVVFGLDFSNSVNADGADAFADSEITLDIDSTEEFFSDLISDTTFGDEKNGVALGTFGDLISDAGISIYTVTLAPGASNTLDMVWTQEDFSGDYTSSGLAAVDLSAILTVTEVNNVTTPTVPEPGTLLLLLSGGLLGLPWLRRRRA